MLPSIVWLALFACNESDDTGTVPTNGGGEVEDCGSTAPTIDGFEVRPEGMSGDECSLDDGSAAPTIRLAVDGDDVDGDLTSWTIRAWSDETVDGSVDTSAGGYMEVWDDMDDVEPCSVHDANLAMVVCVTGHNFDFQTTYEFAAVLMDNLDNEAQPAIATFTTPDRDGMYE